MKWTKTDYISFINGDTPNNISEEYILITGLGVEDRKSILTLEELFKNKKKPRYTYFICKQSQINMDTVLDSNFCHSNYNIIDDTVIENIVFKIVQKIDDIYTCVDKIILNVTSLKRIVVMPLLTILRKLYPQIVIDIIYVTPRDYGSYEIDNYSHPKSMAFMPHIPNISKPTLLFLMTGYEKNGEFGLIRYYNPSVLVAGYADPPTEEDFKSRNIENYKAVIQNFANDEGIQIKETIFNGNNPIECFKNLEALIFSESKFADSYNILIAPMNNKLSTIGAYLLFEKYPEVNIVDINGEAVHTNRTESGKKSVYYLSLPIGLL